ncbi:lipase member H-B-like isoform X2 [Hyposmocoma kahamanoa]|uniref:lipase member H-B-like isoform X2 n=1 Tax=Hyposmocoma kahamanoa TaxID=1477025 RepID=UPI000E6D80D3|nr:lipase member H-B-like isoform X2 [Hyposmocoma kahamanoa]
MTIEMIKVLLFCFAILAASLGKRKASQLFSSSYILYTKTNHKFGQSLVATPDSVKPLTINSGTICAVIVHGYGGKGTDSMSLVLRDAFLGSGNTNVIVVDWTVAAGSNMASEAVPAIADNVAELLKLMVISNKISKTKLHLVGFDLGAHVVGNVGRIFQGVARITALNPYGADEWMLSNNHLRATDARYVEVIHTEVSQIGLPVAVGDVDFFPQGGVRQPGCQDLDCSHNRAWKLFAASLTHGGLIGHRCETIRNALDLERFCTGFALPLGTNELVKYGQ